MQSRMEINVYTWLNTVEEKQYYDVWLCSWVNFTSAGQNPLFFRLIVGDNFRGTCRTQVTLRSHFRGACHTQSDRISAFY